MAKRTFILALTVLSLVRYTATCALADTPVDSKQEAMDTGWVLLAGFAMLTAGFSRSKNACNMLMKKGRSHLLPGQKEESRETESPCGV